MRAIETNLYEAEQVFRTAVPDSYGYAAIQDEALTKLLASLGWTWSKVMGQLTGGDRAKTDRVAPPFHLTRRVGDPSAVGAAVAFLLSPAASAVTGADWAVHGGDSAMGPEQATPAIPQLTE